MALLGIIFLAACSSPQQQVVCNPPYLLVGNACCLDQNSNSVCDKDESSTIKVKETANTQTVAQKDKCSYLDESVGLTSTELQQEYYICYQGKYINYATTINDTDVCQEIVKPWYYSPCVASVASQKSDIDLCDDIRLERWEAKGYFEELNTKDLCYSVFVTYKYSGMTGSQVEEACNKISHKELKAECLKLKELSSLFSVGEGETNPNLQIISQVNRTSGGYLYITGEVKNNGTTVAKSVKVFAKFYKNNAFVDRDYTYVDNYDIPAGQIGTFEIMWEIKPYDRYELTVTS